jgi:hypothetical protein
MCGAMKYNAVAEVVFSAVAGDSRLTKGVLE